MKFVCSVLFFLFASTSAIAQFSVGLKAGMSVSDYSVKTKYDHSNKFGFTTGVVVMNTIGTNIGIQADILFVQKGYLEQKCNQCFDKFTSSFIEVPLAFRYSFYLPKISPKLANLKAHAVGGMYLSSWLSAKYDSEVFGDRKTEDYVFTGEKRLDFGPNFGAGLEYALFSGSLSLDFRYSLGLVDMSAPGSTDAQKNRSSIFTLSYLKSF